MGVSKRFFVIFLANMSEVHNVIIIGSGPAAHTAAIYAARAELKPLLFEGALDDGNLPGGQLMTTTDVENFPGFPGGMNGPELMDNLRAQSEKFGTKIFTETIVSLDTKQRPFVLKSNTGEDHKAKAVIIATGATARRLEIPGAGDDGYWQKGVSACAVCDGAIPIFRKKPLLVIGGGDSAMEEATFLTKYGSKVTIIHRRDELRASKVMQVRAQENPKIEFLYSHVVTEVKGEKFMKQAKVKDLKTNEERWIDANGLFFAIGHDPNVKFLDGQLDTDDQGYVKTVPGSTHTSVEGVFAAGDVQDKKYRQAITAAGSGCMAALDCEHYLASL